MLNHAQQITLAQQEAIYRGGPFRLDPAWKAGVDRSAAIVAQAAAGSQPIYGINTGLGKLASVRIPPEDTRALQRNLILSHSAGVGDPLPRGVVRLVMAQKILSLSRGASGIRWELIALLAAMLDKDVLPVVPSQGSVGASGDLVPLAHVAATMMGHHDVVYQGVTMPASEALSKAGLSPVRFQAKEGLALINGTQVSTALALAGLFDAWRIVLCSLTTGALSTDGAMGSPAPFRPEIHQLRGHEGQIAAAATLRHLLEGSQIRDAHRQTDPRVQDPYCIRCQPQVLGAVITVMRQAAATLHTEATAVTDNPLVLPDGSIVSGGNFHGEPVGFAADMIAMAIAEAGAIAQRRVALLVDPTFSYGLPAFLSPEPGLHSGMMAVEITSAALAAENKALANPRVVDSTPTSANQEDHVAMSCHAAYRLRAMNRNLARLVGVEAVCSAQAVELRAPLKTSPVLQEHLAAIRSVSAPLDEDRALHKDIEKVAGLVERGVLLPAESPSLEP